MKCDRKTWPERAGLTDADLGAYRGVAAETPWTASRYRRGTPGNPVARFWFVRPHKQDTGYMASMFPDVISGSPELSTGERIGSVIVGLTIAAAGAKPRPNVLLNVAALAAGSYLAYRGATGYCPIKAALSGARA